MLSLMRWGMDNGVVMNPVAAHHPDNDQLMTQINLMQRWKPRDAMEFLLDPERDQDGSVTLQTEELATEPTAEDAAGLLLQMLLNAMVVTAP